MVQNNGLLVSLKSNGQPLDEHLPYTSEPAKYRYRLLTAEPGAKFTLSLTVEPSFDWEGANTLFVVITTDISQHDQVVNQRKYTQVCLIPQRHLLLRASTYGVFYTLPGIKDLDPYRMPRASKTVEPPCVDGSFLQSLNPSPGCVSVYIHRGSMPSHRLTTSISQITRKRKTHTTDDTSISSRFETSPIVLELQETLVYNVCSFHFRNIEATTSKTEAPPLPSGGTSNSTVERGAAQKRKPLPKARRPMKPVKSAKVTRSCETGEDDGEEFLPLAQMPKTAKKRKPPAPAKKCIKPVKAGRATKARHICETEDEDDEEFFHLDQAPEIKSEPQPKEPVFVQARAQHISNAETRVAKGEDDRSNRSRGKKGLEMRLCDIELEREALQIKRQLLEFDD